MPDQEPVVSVRNIPQSQYESQQGMQSGGGIRGHLQRNWPIYAVGIGLLTIAVMIYLNYRNSGGISSSPTSTTDSGSTWGAQLDSDYQQMISNQNQTVGLLQQLLNQGKNSSGGGGTPTPPGPPTPGPNNPPQPPTPPTQAPSYYTVVSGDNLSHIADTHGFASWQSLYNFGNNTQTVMNTAKQHGITSNYQDWIYPGEQIQVK